MVRSAGSQELLLTAAAPIVIEGRTRGGVFLEQAGDQLLALRDRAVTRLFNLTLLATAAAVIVMLGFATWISLRIGRLRSAADSAVSSDGKIRLEMPECRQRRRDRRLVAGIRAPAGAPQRTHASTSVPWAGSCRTNCARR